VSRLPPLRHDDLDPDQRQVWDSIAGTRDTAQPDTGGGLPGPFNAFVHAPGVGQHLTSLGLALRYHTSIERRLTEVAILSVGAHWQAEFEWWAHAKMARRHGVAEPVIEAIRRGEDPPFEAGDERAVHAVACQLASTGRISQDAYDAAHQVLGDTGMVELVTLCGYYTLISYLLNGFDVPLPPGETPAWDGAPSGPA
jgi:4-carboxymuconolactone decarboxylase